MGTERTGPALRRCVLAACLALLGACREEAPPWVHLADGFRPAALAERIERAGIALRPAGPDAVWLETEVPPGAWRPGRLAGTWEADLPFPRPLDRYALGGDTGLRFVESEPGEPSEPGSYTVRAGRLRLRPPDGVAPAGGLALAALLDRGELVDGRWRVRFEAHTGDGLPVASGLPAAVTRDVPAESALRFFFAARSLTAPDAGAGAGGGTAELEVLLDGVVLVRAAPGEWCSVDLPDAGAGARFEFRLLGPPAAGAVLAPVIGPADAGSAQRPDMILFLADTFRADILSPWGGDGSLAPRLERQVARGLRFTRAWAPASWTLPSQASMLTGVWPPQHGATMHGATVSSELVTVAERLRSAGYRTGAVTDSGFVSGTFGFAQGFDWFVEHKERSLALTLDDVRAFLAAGDGRPTFLFVQTYRTHHPYRTGTEESDQEWEDFFREHAGRFDLPVLRMQAEDAPGPPRPEDEEARATIARLRELYDAGVLALDAQVGAWLEELEASGWFERGHLLWTSDHGEAFGEHGDLWHGGILWEELMRVPLWMRGPGIEPGAVDFAASLVDVPRTLAALADVPPAPLWGGVPLHELDVERRVFGFGVGRTRTRIAVVDGDRKVLAPGDPEGLAEGVLDCAFDLAADPGERENLRDEATWPAELCREVAGHVRELEVRLVDPDAADMGADAGADLEALGYAGEE